MLGWFWRSAGWTVSLTTSLVLSQLPTAISSPISSVLLPREQIHYTTDGDFIELRHGRTYYSLLEPTKEDDDESNSHKKEEDDVIASKLEFGEECEKIINEIPSCATPANADRPPLVIFLHGVNLFAFVWDSFAKLLSKRGYRVLTFDFYGHGHSAIPDVEYTADVLCEQVEDLVRQLGLADIDMDTNADHKTEQEVYVVGHSMGGLIASEFTARHGNLVTKLVLLNSVGLPVNTRKHLIPGVVHISLLLFRRINIFDNILLRIGNVIGTHSRLLGLSHHDIIEAAHNLHEKADDIVTDDLVTDDEDDDYLPPLVEDEDDMQLISTKSNNDYFSTYKRMVNSMNKGSQLATSKIRNLITQSHNRNLERISYIDRGIRGLSFVIKAWMYQCSISLDRGRVWLSLFRNIPLLDAGRHETFGKIRENDTPLLLIWGTEDAILPPSTVLEFQRCIPNAQVEMVEGDHGLFLQKPNKIFSLIYRFISNTQINK